MAVHDSLCKQKAKLLNYGYTRLVERIYHLILPHTHVAEACKLHADEYPTLYFVNPANTSSQPQKRKSPMKKFDCNLANDDQYKCSGPLNANEKCSERYHFVNTKDASTLMAAVDE